MDFLDMLLENLPDSPPNKEPDTNEENEETNGVKHDTILDQEDSEVSSSSSTVLSESTPHWAEFFETDPWADDLKPFFKLAEHEESTWEEEEESEGILTDNMINSGLSFTSPCPMLYNYSLNKLRLPNKNLSNIYKIGDYKFLQYVDLSRNNLRDLLPLQNLPFLMYLDVSYNKIGFVLGFPAPLNLTYANFSHNEISFIDDLTDFWSLVKLNLSHNDISRIEGLQNLRYLRVLDLSFNKIERFENLCFLRLTHLYLQNNKISEFEEGEVKSLDCLQHVNLDFNNLKSLSIFEDSISLQNVSLQENEIAEIFEMEYLKASVSLRELNLIRNIVTQWPEYRGMVISTLPSLCVLDRIRVSSDEKASAKNTFDPDMRFVAARNYSLLLIMEQLNNPIIEPYIFPVDQTPLPIVILVGPLASGNGGLTRCIAEKFPNKVHLGVCHTSRPKSYNEINGYHYYFVTKDEMNELAHCGAFVAFAEILGESYGLDRTELTKAYVKKCLCITHMDIVGATAFYNRGLKPHLVLAMPKSEEIHKQRLKKKPCIGLRCNQEQCQKKQVNAEEDWKKKHRDTIEYFESMFTESFLKKTFESEKMEKERNEKLRRSTIDFISTIISDSLLDDFIKTKETELQAVSKAQKMNLRRNTIEVVGSLIEETFAKSFPEEERFEIDRTERRSTVDFIQSLIKESFLKNIPKEPILQKYEEEQNLSQYIESLVKDSFLKYLSEKEKKPCYCLTEESEEILEEEIPEEEGEKGDDSSKPPSDTFTYIKNMLINRALEYTAQDEKPAMKSAFAKEEETLARLPMSAEEYIALGAIFTDSFLLETLNQRASFFLDREEEEEKPRETLKYIESLLTESALKHIRDTKAKKPKIKPKKKTCPECDFAASSIMFVIESRKTYFKIKEQNKHFFSSVLYTDDFNDACQILADIVKEIYRNASHLPPIFYEEHGRFKESIPNRLNFYMSEINKHHHIYEEEKEYDEGH